MVRELERSLSVVLAIMIIMKNSEKRYCVNMVQRKVLIPFATTSDKINVRNNCFIFVAHKD